MGAEMRRLRLTKLLIITVLAVLPLALADLNIENNSDDIRAARIRRDVDGVTTVLLVPARHGKAAPPVGVLTKTARTFVQDGASTEYATQVLGTTLDNGRLYAKILSTSSRVFYDKEPSPDPSVPYVVYPSKTSENDWHLKLGLDDTPLKIVEKINDATLENLEDSVAKESLNDNDIFNKQDEVRFKPSKVRMDNLPTYTVKQDYVTRGLDIIEEEQPKSFRPRVPKIFRPQPKAVPKKESKPLATVTYHGFADFVTTVGDTVIVFSPSTSPVPVGRPATTIKGDATLRPDDGIAVLKIKPTNVIPTQAKTETIPLRNREPTNKVQQKSRPVENKNVIDLQPSTIEQPEIGFSGESTSPLLLVPDEKTGSLNPTGLIKVIDSTAIEKGTTTHYMSSIYGTYIGTNYAQIVHTSSNVYFYPEDSTKGFYVTDNDGNRESKDVESISTLPPETTDNILTTIKDILTTEPTTENELGNDIIPQSQGRSIKGPTPKNQLDTPKGEKNRDTVNKLSLPTRVVPSTIYKTYTYYTTFFIPDNDKTSTSVKSREEVSSEIVYLTELILPSSTQTSLFSTKSPMSTNKVEVSSNTDLIENTNNSDKQEVEEIQLIFKTIFTTFTYLTTFYDDSTTSVSSRKVTATNVITQTVDPVSTSIDFDGLIEKETQSLITPTKVADVSFINSKTNTIELPNVYSDYATTEESTENILTTVPDQITTVEDQPTTTESTTESNKDDNDSPILLEPSPIAIESTPSLSEQLKTYYTTYTYFTTIIVDDETEIETRTEVFSNIITDTIKPTEVLPAVETTAKKQAPPQIEAYLKALLAKKLQEQTVTNTQSTTEETTEMITEDPSTFTAVTDETTIMDDAVTTERMSNDGEVLGSMKTDVIFTSSSGGSTLLDLANNKMNLPEDQELSETNHHEVEPAPTLLLQTSYTTYTYFTTMYNGDATDVVSRLKTVTNVVTETIKPTAVMQPETKTLQPLTYFTTFTYWTTFIKGDETATTSREETVSNVVTPSATETPSLQLDVVKTYRPFVLATPVHSANSLETRESKATSDNEVTTSPNVILKEIPTIKVNELSSTISPEPMTLYTTYTYFTTSYIGNSTILNSRLETVTSVSYPDDLIVKATPRAIGGSAPSQVLNTEEKPIEPSKVNDSPKTGLLSTIRLSQVNDDTTTHFMTDIYGTYIDGLYAQVVKTSSKVELPTPVYQPTATPVLPTGVLSLNKGSIVDADEITTVFYTTQQIGTSINGLYAKVIESTSSTKVDDNKLATHTPVHGHRTGLVRLIKGLIETNDTTTYYQSKVIGTSIDGRYAQIIESTSSYLIAKPTSVLDIAPTSTLPPNHATGTPEISPSPAVIQSSISEDGSNDDPDQDENENDDEGDDQKSKKKSRLTFSSRKRTSSAPPIRPFASRSRPTFNPKRKPQGATTITRSDITPTVTATLAGKGSRFASSRGRATPALGSSTINASSSRRFSGRRSSLPSTSSFATNYSAGSSRNRGVVRATPSSAYSGSRRGPTSIRGSSARPSLRGSSSLLSPSSTRYRPGIRPSSTIQKISPTIRQDDQEDNANEFTTATLVTEETPLIQEDNGDETIPPTIQTTTESAKRANNPLLRFRRPPAFGSGIRTTTPRATTTTSRRTNNPTRQNTISRTTNLRTRPTVSSLTTRARPAQSSLFPPRTLFGRKPETTEAPVENKDENFEGDEENFEDEPVEEITDNDYEGSEQKESSPAKQRNNTPQIRPFSRVGRGRRVRRQTSQSRPLSSRFRRPVQTSTLDDRSDSDVSSSKEDISKPVSNSRYGSRGRSLTSNSRTSYNAKEDKSSEEYYDSPNTQQSRSRSKPISNRGSLRVKPSNVSNSNRQFTLREKESSPIKSGYKRPTSTSRSNNLRTRTNSRPRTGTSRYQDATNNRRTSSRTSTRTGSRTNNRRVPSRGRLGSHEDYRDFNDFDGTITVTHYVPTEVTIPVVNNGITEKRNIITAQPSTEVIGPDRYSTITNSDGRDLVVLASELTSTNFQGQVEVTRFVIHETPTTKVSHTLTSSGARRFSQPVVVPSTIYSIENIVSTVRPSIPDNAPLANILLSQLLLGQLGQNPLLPGAPTQVATPTTRYDTRATTYVTTITKSRSTVIPLTFRGKEILTTLVDSSTDVVTATEFITDTVVVTPTVALPQANLNSLLLLLQQPQTPQQPNPLLDPLLAAQPLLTQSNTLPGEVERRNQPVDFDYKPESYEDLSEEEVEKPSKARGKTNAAKTNDKEAPESSVITLYVSGRRPGEFSTVLSTVKAGDESTSTKIKRDINEAPVIASLSPSLQLASEPASYYLAGSEEPIDAHSPTQSEEQDARDSPDYEGLFNFGRKAEDVDEYVTGQEDDYVSNKRVRIRVPVVRSRNTREHAVTVVRRRPLVPYGRSSLSPIESPFLPTARRIVTRTKVRKLNFDPADFENNLTDDVSNELFTRTNRHKVTVTRRRKIKPTATVSTSHRERITRKKLVTVRPVTPEPQSTLAIITTGFYTVPSFEKNEEEYFDEDSISTPELFTSSFAIDSPINTEPFETEKTEINYERISSTSDPIIITDNFFFPAFEETTANDFDEESHTNSNEFVDAVTESELRTQTESELRVQTESELRKQTESGKSADTEVTTEKKFESTENFTEKELEEITTETEPTTTTMTEEDDTTDIPQSSIESNGKTVTEDESITISPTDQTLNNTDLSSENDKNLSILNVTSSLSTIKETESETPVHDMEDNLTVVPISTKSETETVMPSTQVLDKEVPNAESNTTHQINENDIPSVIPLQTKSSSSINDFQVTTLPSLTPEDIEAGLTDDLYLSLSRPDFPQIIPSKVESEENINHTSESSQTTPELQTSVYYSETVVTSTRLRTYTYVVTKLNGKETEVTSSTTVRPRVTTLTLTVPVTVTVTPTVVSPPVAFNSSLENKNSEEVEDEGRRFNLATRVMSNGVEVIVAGTTPAYRWENSNPQPTLTLSEAVVMLLPQDKPNEFVTKTCTTTFTYLNTITRDGTTMVSTDQQVIANTATEERHRKPASEAASVTLEASPTLQTEVFKTTYTYLMLNTDHPDEKNALGSSTRVIANTVTAPQYYLDMILEPSEAPRPETNTYLSTRVLEKTYIEDGKTKYGMTNDVVTQLIITESALPVRSPSVTPTLTGLDEPVNPTTDIAKTYYITYTYLNTYLEKNSTVVKTNIATSSDIVYEKVPLKKTATSVPLDATPEPIQIFATKTYLTTFTYFTTLLQAGAEGEISTITSSRSHVVENVVTESIAPSLLDPGYMNALLTSSHHSDSLKNVVTGSTIIFFDDEEEISPTTTSAFEATASLNSDKGDNLENTPSSPIEDSAAAGSETNEATSQPIEQDNSYNEEDAPEQSTDTPSNKKPLQVSNLLSLGSLGINSLSALGPVITAMAGLLQGKTSASRRNDSEAGTEPPVTTTQRSPIYIPVAEFVDGDIETAESQNIALHLANNNHLPETRHKVTASLVDGIPISPGEVITANSDVIIGKPGKLGPRPPQTYLSDQNIDMKPPPVSVPNVPTHPVLEVAEKEPIKNSIKIQKGSQQLEIYPAQQIYEEHVKVPLILNQPAVSKRPQIVQHIFQNPPPNVISSKQDVLENDPLLIPPDLPNVNINTKNRKTEKNRRPWSPKDPLSASNILIEDKNRLNYQQKELAHIDSIGTVDLSRKPHGPEPIVHQVPHVIDRSTGQPLLVNIQPSQVANVVIPQGGTQALIFGDTNEPHISGQYFDDPSPYPEPEVGPGFVGIDKVENLPQFTNQDNLADYMTPPSPPTNLQTSQNSNIGNRPHVIPLSHGQDFKQHFNTVSRPEKIPIRHHDSTNLSGGQGHVHTEILVHHGSDNGHLRLQSRPTIPSRNQQPGQFPPRKEHTKIHFSEPTPPRRTEVPLPTENTFYDTNVNWKNEKKPLRNDQTRWPRPTNRPRLPTKITNRPYGRPIRPIGPIRQQPFPHAQRPVLNTHYQNEYTKNNQVPSTQATFSESNYPLHESGFPPKSPENSHYHEQNYGNVNFGDKGNNTTQGNNDYSSKEHIVTQEYEYKVPSSDNLDSTKYPEKTIDSEVDASENVKISSGPQKDDEEDFVVESDDEHLSTIKFNHNSYLIGDGSIDNEKTLQNNSSESFQGDDGEIIIGSEKKHDHYLSQSPVGPKPPNNKHIMFNTKTETERNPTQEIIDLKPPAIIPTFEPNGHSRPYSKPQFILSNSETKPDIITESPERINNMLQGHIHPGVGQVLHVQGEKIEQVHQSNKNDSYLYANRRRPRPDYTTRVHPDHPQIITKPKPQLPQPVVISSGKIHKQNNNRKSSVQFSLPIDSTGEENDSKTQTERPPSIDTTVSNLKTKEESLDTAFQTNFANPGSEDENTNERDSNIKPHIELHKSTTPNTIPLRQDMVPPPATTSVKSQGSDEGLKPPPAPTDVLGLSPPPVDITTTLKPLENKSKHHKISADVSGLKPPPLYIPLKDSGNTPPLPSVSMVPPSPRPSVVRPYLADILSQDMVPPPPDVKTTRPIEIATVRPGVAVSGSIQIATAVATSHIPVIQDMESKIPIVHGTVDLPVVIDVPDFLKSIDTKKPDHVSVYTVRPFETKQRITIKPTISSNPSSTVMFKQSQIHDDDYHVYTNDHPMPTKVLPSHTIRKSSTGSELPIILEPSTDIHLPASKIKPTEALVINDVSNEKTKVKSSAIVTMTKAPNEENTKIMKEFNKSNNYNQNTKKTDLKIKESASKMMEIIGTVVHEFIQNSTNERAEIKPQEVTRYETLTVTRTETAVVGSPPTTRTLLITHTLTSTRVETVTETLLRPTSVISTITSTILQSVTHVPVYEHGNDNESIFVVMSDQKPPAPGAEEVEAEYGEEDVSRDEQDVSGNEIHRVLSGGILGAPSVPIRSPKVQCVPECKASKSEICAESSGEMRCVCRPGFSRMFPDRPCKPTYTFTVGVGLDRIGRDHFVYGSEMNDTSSVAFKHYAHPVNEALDRMLMQSDLRDVYRGIHIAKFASDPERVVFNVQLSSNTDEVRLKEVIRKYLVMSNYSLGGTDVFASKDLGMIEAKDFNECVAEEGPHHDCSPQAICYNLKGSYQCSCKEGYTDLSENPIYPGRICSQAPIGCVACNYKGHCVVNTHGQEVCECFTWHSGQKCQVNLKVLLIALVTTGVILLGLLAVCVGLACFRNPSRRRRSADQRAMISGAGGDTSSEGSIAELAIPHHVPHILPPPPQMMAPAPPVKKSVRKISGKPRRAPRKPAPVIAPVPISSTCPVNEQRDRSLTVMIPRAKYRSAPQPTSPQNYKPMSTFAVDEHKLIDYLEGGAHPGHRKPSLISNSEYKDSEHKISKQHANFTPSGALVSAGFQVSATVTRTLDAESTLARSCGETTVEPSTKVIRSSEYPQELDATLVRSCAETTIQSSAKLLRLDLAEAGSTLARSCGETTIQPPTKMADRKDCNRDARDSASEGHTMAERDLGSTLRLPAQHAPLYNQDRTSSDRESNFDSL